MRSTGTHRTRRAVATLALATAALVLGTAIPAGAASPWWWWPRTTTTTKPTTTTTAAPTTTVAPTTTTTQPPTTTTTAPPTGAPCGGVTPTKADGTPWACTFSDEFEGTSIDRDKWVVQETVKSGFTVSGECFVDDPDNMSVANGTLRLTARVEAQPMSCTGSRYSTYTTPNTSGSVTTYGKFSQTYGRFEVRAKMPDVKVKGMQTAIWLWPDNATKYGKWPASGEIDIAEYYTVLPDRVIPYIHYVQTTLDKTNTNNTCIVNDPSQFHLYAVEWTPTRITISYDGKVCISHSWSALNLLQPAPFDHPFMVNLTQNFGIYTNAYQPGITPVPATAEFDYVRVWK